MVDKKCKHRGTWLISTTDYGCYEWCWMCGALRYLVKVKGCNAYTPETYWQRPQGVNGKNPATLRERPLKLLNHKKHLTTEQVQN